jgi:cytochrome c2
MRARVLVPAVVLAASFVATCAWAQGAPEGAQLFAQRCQSCHTMGEGNRVGPDLAGVMERRDEVWLTKFMKSPGAMIDGGDPVANELLKKFMGIRMPDQQLSDAERASLFAFFKGCGKGGCKGGGPKMATDASPEEIERGRRLFEGHEKLASGGPPCLGCHHVRGAGVVGGGTLGKDLTFAFARMGEKGLKPALKELPYPLMRDVYARAPLNDEEQYALLAYLADASRDGTPPRKDREFLYLGLVGMCVALGFFGIVLGGHGRSKDAGGGK